MILLILSPNLVTLMLGWDGLGISSFFLVIFYKRNKAFNAGILTAFTNRVGDALILVSFSLFLPFSSFTLPVAGLEGFEPSYFIRGVLVVAARTKRAQIPFRAWLPAAMAAPTPVSALVHSSTLVTAGVYLLFRLSATLSYPSLLTRLGGLGAATSLIASFAAFLETDLKKVVALSTLSQLGVIVLSMSLAFPGMAFFHLVVHAFFKALLFIATGNVIHNSNDYQDMRLGGGNSLSLPFNQATIVLTKLSLCGLPFFSAFYSKEFILERLGSGSFSSVFVFFRMWLGVLFTCLYSARFIYYTTQTNWGAPVVWKADRGAPLVTSKLLLILPGLLAGKLLLPLLVDNLTPPAVSVGAKIAVLSLIFAWAPLLFWSSSFSPTLSSFKSLGYLFFLSRWRGSEPLALSSHLAFSSIWGRRFGWKDWLLGLNLISVFTKIHAHKLTPRISYFKVVTIRILILGVWLS